MDEKDEAGNILEFVAFETASPYIMVAFFCYVTDMIKRRRVQLVQLLEGDETNSLEACFEQSGLKKSDMKKKVITYAMTEQAIFFFKQKNAFGAEQLEMVLR